MAQERIFTFLDLDTSQRHNRRFVGIIKPGVYRGFYPRVSSIGTNRIDVTRGNDVDSILVTSEGVIVTESADLSGEVLIDFSTITLERMDLCVCEYQYTSNTLTPAIYKVLKGTPVSSDPVPPETQNAFQVPLFYVHIRQGATSLEQVDLRPVVPANTVLSSDLGGLKPEIDPTDRSRVYVHPGTFPNRTGDTLLIYRGGYSAKILSSDINDGETKYFIIGISDDLEVGKINASFSPTTVAGYGSDALPLCIAKTTRSGANILIESITDIRTSFTRRLVPQFEEDTYTDVLANSILKYVRYDLFEDTDLIDLTTISTTDVIVEVTKADTSLTFTKDIPGSLASDVTIVTEDLLDSMGLNPLYYIMLLADSPNANITFDYSTASKVGGFTGQYYNLNEIVRIPQGASTLFLKFKIPASDLNVAPVKIFSYGLFLELDYENLNTNSVDEAGLIEVVKSQKNLINNPFVWWSRPDNDGSTGDPFTTKELVYTLAPTQEKIDADQDCHGPDGWQLVEVNGSVANSYLWKRIYRNNQPGMELYMQNIAGSVGLISLEHRVPIGGLVVDRHVTFAVDYDVTVAGTFSIVIQLYRLQSGVLIKQGNVKALAPIDTSGTVTITTDNLAGQGTIAVGFVLNYQGAAISSGHSLKIYNPRAVFGRQANLQVSPDVAQERSLPYYQRGRALVTVREIENADIGTSLPIFPKNTILGDQKSALIGDGDNIHVANVSLEHTRETITATGVTQRSGSARLDIEWHTYIHYNKVEI